MNNVLSLFATATIFTASPTTAHVLDADEIQFATAEFDRWHATGYTKPSDGAGPPRIANAGCYVGNDDMVLHYSRAGDSSIYSLGGVDGPNILKSHHVLIDKARYETKPVETGHITANYSDILYPSDTGIVTSDFRGFLGVRRASSHPYLPLSSFVGELLQAKKVIFVGQDDAPFSIQVDMKGFASAMVWCQRAMAGPIPLKR